MKRDLKFTIKKINFYRDSPGSNKNIRYALLLIRWVVGLLFIFSGLVKANDPVGLSYKMQEFFFAWGLQSFNDISLALALFMNVFEVLAGVAIILGWRTRLFTWLLLLLIIFFTFLTSYAVFSGKIKTCGCFGDCLPLTPVTSLIKDLVLLALIIILFIKRKRMVEQIPPSFSIFILSVTVAATILLQAYVLQHLPIIDCLPYKKGNNLVEQMQLPDNAIQDSVVMTFKYRKNGEFVEFNQDEIPEDLDSTYEFIDRYDKVVVKGNAQAPITDFSLQTLTGNDTTKTILSQPFEYVMLFVKDFSTLEKWNTEDFQQLVIKLRSNQVPLIIVTADKNKAQELFGSEPSIDILLCDATVIKTAARVNPTYFLMKQANILGKYSYADLDELNADMDVIINNR